MDVNFWQEIEDDVVTLGLTPEFQEELGDIGYVDITSAPKIQEGDTLVIIEATKVSIEMISPISGAIVARNEVAEANPTLLDSEYRTNNWIVKIKQ